MEDLKTISTKIITEIKSKIKTTTCNVCNKKNKINKGVPCKTCIYPLHRKCCKLRLGDIHDIRKDKLVQESLTCTLKSFLSLQQNTRKL